MAEKSAERDSAKAALLETFRKTGLSQYTNPETKEILIHPDFYGKGKNKVKGFNVNSVQQLRPVLQNLGVAVEKSLDKTALAWLAPDHQIVRDYLHFKSLDTACAQVEKLITHAQGTPINGYGPITASSVPTPAELVALTQICKTSNVTRNTGVDSSLDRVMCLLSLTTLSLSCGLLLNAVVKSG